MKISVSRFISNCCCSTAVGVTFLGYLVLSALVLPAQAQLVLAHHLTYDIVYDYSKMSPSVVMWQLQASDFAGSYRSKSKHFRMDVLLPPPHRRDSEFSYLGFVRGHLCPAADRDSRKDWVKDTYVTSNIVPMAYALNSGVWAIVEDRLRTLCSDGHVLRIAAGVMWNTQVTTAEESSSMAVPGSFFKIARCVVHPRESWAWICMNSNGRQDLAGCTVSIDSVYRSVDSVISSYIQQWIGK